MTDRPKRSLVLAGGGMKVAFQAGVLQVWLDEAGLDFDHVDGASGGTFNLALYCMGRSGTQIADAWRALDPVEGAEVSIGEILHGDGLLSMDRYRSTVFPSWGLDWDTIQSSGKEATFNVCHFNDYELMVVTPDRMSEDFLVACAALPMWFPPVDIDGETYLDAVYLSDGNLEEAIRRGADEIWVIWTVSEEGAWRPGFVNTYFQVIEIVANGNFRRVLERIDRNNAAVAAGRAGEFGRKIDVKVLRGEVPVNYLLEVGADRLHEAVERGVEAARAWCAAAGIPLRDPASAQASPVTTAEPSERVAEGRPGTTGTTAGLTGTSAVATTEPSTLSFTEEMKGFVTAGEIDFQEGFRRGQRAADRLSVRLTISVD
ncbi:MAG TPA: patatin-like phospholipase family protein, partial [Kineosporiaceae bacterium]